MNILYFVVAVRVGEYKKLSTLMRVIYSPGWFLSSLKPSINLSGILLTRGAAGPTEIFFYSPSDLYLSLQFILGESGGDYEKGCERGFGWLVVQSIKEFKHFTITPLAYPVELSTLRGSTLNPLRPNALPLLTRSSLKILFPDYTFCLGFFFFTLSYYFWSRERASAT